MLFESAHLSSQCASAVGFVAMCWITCWASREELAVPGAGSSSAVTEAFDMSGQNLIDLLQRRGVGGEGDREFPTINGG